MKSTSPNPPYFDTLLHRIAAGDEAAIASFGKHVHWGLWSDPTQACTTPHAYGEAAQNLCDRVCDIAGCRDATRIVDVGCGFGGTIASLNGRFDSLHLIGINIDARQLWRAQDMVTAASGNRIDWIAADAASLPIAPESIDIVLAVECIFHFDRARFIAEAARVLRPGGTMTISDFVPTEAMASFMALQPFADSEAVRWSYGSVDMSCSLAEYERIASANGLQMTVTDDITTGTLPTYDFLLGQSNEAGEPQAHLFREATKLLQKVSQKGMIQYMILRFDKVVTADDT